MFTVHFPLTQRGIKFRPSSSSELGLQHEADISLLVWHWSICPDIFIVDQILDLYKTTSIFQQVALVLFCLPEKLSSSFQFCFGFGWLVGVFWLGFFCLFIYLFVFLFWFFAALFFFPFSSRGSLQFFEVFLTQKQSSGQQFYKTMCISSWRLIWVTWLKCYFLF